MSTSPVPSAETFWIVSGSDAQPRLGHCTPRCSEGDRAEPAVADYGLLESVLARPRATVMGQDAYVAMYGKASAFLHH